MSVTPSGPCFLAIRDVCRIAGLARTEIYRRMARGAFPQAVKVGPQTTRWLDVEVHAWVAQQAGECPRVGMKVAS